MSCAHNASRSHNHLGEHDFQSSHWTRREFTGTVVGAMLAGSFSVAAERKERQLNYLVGSCLYGETALAEILPELKKVGSNAIDIWPRVHGNQREQLDEMGEERFAELLKQHGIQLGCITQYQLGPFQLSEEMKLAQRLGCQTIVTGGVGPKGLKGKELKTAVADFVKQMQPHLAVAKETGVVIAIENHANNLIESEDALKWLIELEPSPHLGIALAPYHLPQEPSLLANLIRHLGDRIAVFYAWQHGQGSTQQRPKEQGLLQMPGRGSLDFAPLVDALKDINYRGWTEIFMHPFPRGIAIMETTSETTREISFSKAYLDRLL